MATRKKAAVKKTPKGTKDIELAVAEVVDYMRIRGDFGPALAEVVERKMAVAAARGYGLRVTGAELQKAADAFRAMQDLHKASDTNRWLKANGVTLEALEEYLETNILISKLKDRLAKNAPKRLHTSREVKDTVRQLAYEEWLANAMK